MRVFSFVNVTLAPRCIERHIIYRCLVLSMVNKTAMNVSHKRVQSTNDSSILSKYSMVKAGYFKDEFIKYFVSKDARRSPLIHRGYHIRMKCIDHMLRTFLTAEFPKKQILSLGAGFDTSFFRFNDEGLLQDCKFFEVDYPDVVKAKKQMILKEPTLYCAIGKENNTEDLKVQGLYTDKYVLVGCSLEDLQKLQQVLQQCDLDVTCPTLILTEVVMCYLKPSSSSAVIKWCASMLNSAVFVTYEQVFPDDPFGIIMLNHFKQVGSPLRTINSFPTPQTQVKRYMNQGWPLVRYQDMLQFHSSYSEEEKQSLQQIEIFDEFEEWDLKCIHYMILSAFKGLCTGLSERMITSENSDTLCEVLNEPISVVPQLLPLLSSDKLLRYGHTASILPIGDVIVGGGFGECQGKHMRLSGIDFLHKTQDRWQCKSLTGHVGLGSRMFHTATLLKDMSILVFGGRESPYKPCHTTIVIKPDDTSDDVACHVIDTKGSAPCPRWRHTTTRFDDKEEEKVLVFGGRTTSEMALSDCYILDIPEKTWRKIDLKGDDVIPRHSHTSCLWRDDHVVFTGGLSENGEALSLVQVIDIKTESISTLKIIPSLLPRYSHTAHVLNDHMIIIGGVNQIYTGYPSLVIINLTSLTWRSFNLPVCPVQSPLMLHNHTSLLLDSDHILVFGGGGNCFSFGTHFNSEPIIIDLSSLDI